MAILDPAADLIASQERLVVDFIFRLTGDRSRAGVMSKDICSYVLDNLDSGLDDIAIRCRLFARAFELNEDALRGVDRDFIEKYFRNSRIPPKDMARLYRWEIFLADLPLMDAIPLLLIDRYGFPRAAVPEITGWEAEEVERRLGNAEALIAADRKLKRSDLKDLPFYGFLPLPDIEQSSLSRIMRKLDSTSVHHPKRETLTIALVVALGFIIAILYFVW